MKFKTIIIGALLGALLSSSAYSWGVMGVSGGVAATGPTWSSNQFTSADAATANGQDGTSYDHLAIDGNTGTVWSWVGTWSSVWWKYDLGDGYSHAISRLKIWAWSSGFKTHFFKYARVQGSNNDSDWTNIDDETIPDSQPYTWDFTNTTDYRYIRLVLTQDNPAGTATWGAAIYQVEAYYYE